MSTYTDLHNKIKETIVVGYRPEDRVTTQKVKLYNKENEYWGTFKGRMVSDHIMIHHGVLSDVAVFDSTLQGVKIKDSQGRIYDLDTLADEVAEMSAVTYVAVPDLCAKVNALSVKILSGIDADISYLSGQVDTTNENLSQEISDRISADAEIYQAINSVSTDLSVVFDGKLINEAAEREAYDKLLKKDICKEEAARIAADEDLSDTLSIAFETNKHYKLNAIDPTVYPYQLQEFSVNVIKDGLRDGLVYVSLNHNLLGRIEGNVHGRLLFTVFTNIDERYKICLTPGQRYVFDIDTTQVFTINGYQLLLSRGESFATTHFTLKPTAVEWYKVIWDKATDEKPLLGRITGAYVNAATNQVISGYITIDTEDSSLTAFKTLYKEFDNGSKSVISVNNNLISYNGDNSFSFKKNVLAYDYMPLSNLLEEDDKIFAKVYKDDVEADIKVRQLKVKLLDRKEKVILNEENSFKSAISSDLTSTTFLSVTPANEVYEKKESIRYQYSFHDIADVGFEQPQGYAVIQDLNVQLSDDFMCQISADLRAGEHIPALKKTYGLTKNPVTKAWETNETVEGNQISITIPEDKQSIDIVIVDATQHAEIKKHFVINSAKGLTYEDFSVDIAKSQPMDYEFTEIEFIPEATYPVYVGDKVTDVGERYDLMCETTESGTAKLVIPDKKHDNISREMMVVCYIESADKDVVDLKFVDTEGKPAKVYYEKKLEFKIPTNRYTTLKIQEVQDNVFLLFDLNENSQEGKIAQLKQDLMEEVKTREEDDAFLSAVSDKLSVDVNYLSSEISSAIHRDTKDVSYFGTLLSADDRYDNQLTSFFKRQPQQVELTSFEFKYGFMYHLSAAQGNLVDADAVHKEIPANSFLLFNKNVELTAAKFADIELIKDYDAAVADLQAQVISNDNDISFLSTEHCWLSDALSSDVDALSASLSNTIALSVGKLQEQVIGNDADIVFLSGQHDWLSGSLSADVDALSVALSTEISSLAKRDRKDVSYHGTLQHFDDTSDHHLSCFFWNQPEMHEAHDYTFHYGFMYRLSAEQQNLEDPAGVHVILNANDFLLFNKDVLLKDVKFEDFERIKDYDTAVNALQQQINGNDADIAFLSSEHDALSTSLSSTVDAISADLLSQIQANDADINFLSSDHDKLSTALSNDIDALSASLSSAVDSISADLLSQIQANDADIEFLSAEHDALSTSLSTDIDCISADLLRQIQANDADIEFLSAEHCWLSDEVSVHIKSLSDEVSSLIKRDSKDVSYKGTLKWFDDHEDHHLSCFLRNQTEWLEKDDYVFHYGFMCHLSADQDNLEDANAVKKVLNANDYILFNKDVVLSDVIFDDFEIIKDFSRDMAFLSSSHNELSTSLSSTVDAISADLLNQIQSNDADISYLSGQHEWLSTSLSAGIEQLSTSLSSTVDTISADLLDQIRGNDADIEILSAEHDALSISLSSTVDAISADLQLQIQSNDADIAYLSGQHDQLSTSLNTLSVSLSGISSEMSAAVNSLDGHYTKTLSNDIELSHDYIDPLDPTHMITKTISVDQLVIVDEVTFDRYRLTIRNGSLNLNKIDNILG